MGNTTQTHTTSTTFSAIPIPDYARQAILKPSPFDELPAQGDCNDKPRMHTHDVELFIATR
jgi:hypothetical protein